MRDPILNPIKVVVDPGHGGRSKGAVYKCLEEKEVTLKIGINLAEMLDAGGYDAFMTRHGDYNIYLSHRAKKANDFDADMFVSIHTNADPDEDEPNMPEAKGSEIWIYPGSTNGRRFATCIMDHIDDEFPGRRFRGIKEARFVVLRRTKMPVVLVEVGFIDTEESLTKFESDLTIYKIAKVLYFGVKEYADRWIAND